MNQVMICVCEDLSSAQHRLCAQSMRVSLTHIQVPGVRLGIYASERNNTQPVVVHLQLALDVRRVADQDAIGSTANYASLVSDVLDVCGSRHFDLLESLVMTLTAAILDRHATVMGVDVEVEKPLAPVAARVSARWMRCRGVSGLGARP